MGNHGRSINLWPVLILKCLIVSLQLIIMLQPTLLVLCSMTATTANVTTDHYHDFFVVSATRTLLCESKEIVTINGEFPGPTLYVNKGDTAYINVHNQSPYKITLHWHGLKQLRNPWSDGPEFITQCGIPPGKNMTYTLYFTNEEGTIWYHAHSDWSRSTVHGAIVVYPKEGSSYPFPKPDGENVIVIGEWYKLDIMAMVEKALKDGGDFNVSDAYTFNGMAGDLYPCSDNYIVQVQKNKTYQLRLVNAALTGGHFFQIANHTITVVGRDGAYLKPFKTNYVWITSGQTMDILVEANQEPGYYYIAATPYNGNGGNIDNTYPTAIFEYAGVANDSSSTIIQFPDTSIFDDSTPIYEFDNQLHSLNSKEHPIDHIPLQPIVDTRLAFDFSVNMIPCPNNSCASDDGGRLATAVNNVSLQNPAVDILHAYYYNTKDVYTEDFPDFPTVIYNFTDETTKSDFIWTEKSTKVKVLKFNETVELALQGIALDAPENHPIHIHGHSFYVVATGFGNFDPVKDPLTYNLVDPPYVNTVGLPSTGWAVIRFRANNPGVWLLHCHLARHLSWGMAAVFIVLDGPTNETSLLPRPTNMPNFCPNKLYSSS